jgi:hypothetical protein
VAIQRQRTYTDSEVDQIIRASERRPGHGGGPTGHVGQRHVLITNVALAARADAFDTDMPVACAFASTSAAVRAVTEALNSTQGQAALHHLDNTFPTGIRVCLEARVAPFVARYSSGMDIVRTASLSSVFVLLERIEEQTYHGLHVQTAFPILSFRRGGPAWRDNTNVWH